MTDTTDYEQQAEVCIRMAEHADDPKKRAQLLTMAQAWRRLAMASERIHDLESRAK